MGVVLGFLHIGPCSKLRMTGWMTAAVVKRNRKCNDDDDPNGQCIGAAFVIVDNWTGEFSLSVAGSHRVSSRLVSPQESVRGKGVSEVLARL